MKKFLINSILFLLIALTACSKSEKKIELTISAAASMQLALTELQEMYEKEHDNVKLFFNYGASGALQKQIEQGAPVDLFFSASSDKFAELLAGGHLDKDHSGDMLGNELVLIQNPKTKVKIKSLQDLAILEVKQVSIGTPESVPAGKYAKESLDNLNIWHKIEDKVIFAKDVRQVLTYVETGNVDAGLVYKTDALSSQKVKIVATVEADNHSPIVYPLGIVKGSKNKAEAIKFFEFLQSEDAAKVFEKYGFAYLQKD